MTQKVPVLRLIEVRRGWQTVPKAVEEWPVDLERENWPVGSDTLVVVHHDYGSRRRQPILRAQQVAAPPITDVQGH